MKMMRNLLASSNDNNRKGRSSSPTVATPVNNMIMALPLGSTDGQGVLLQGVVLGITGQTQAQQVLDYTGTLRYVSPARYAIRGSCVVTNQFAQSNTPNVAPWGAAGGTFGTIGFPDPLGGNDAWSWNGMGFYGNNLNMAKPPVNGDFIVVSISARKETSKGWLLIQADVGSPLEDCWFNLSNGTIGNKSASVIDAWITPEAEGFYRCSVLYQVASSAGNYAFYSVNANADYSTSDGIWHGFGMQVQVVNGVQQMPSPYVGHTTTAPLTTCFGHLPDGTPLRPFYSFQGTFRYDIFEFSPRSKLWTSGNCCEAVASDGIRYYYQGTGGTTAASAPVFNPTGDTVDGTVTWTKQDYCTILGLELAPVGSTNHPEGVLAQLNDINTPSDELLVGFDFLPDGPGYPTDQLLSLAGQTWFFYAGNLTAFTVNAQQRQAATPRAIGLFNRIIGRTNLTNTILYNNGAMFTGATGGPLVKNNAFYIGDVAAATQISGCILNLFIEKNVGLNDSQAIARTQYDLKASVAFDALTGAELTNV